MPILTPSTDADNRRPMFHQGLGVDPVDFNAIASYLHRDLYDNALGALLLKQLEAGFEWALPAADHVWCPGGEFWQPAAAGLGLTNLRGSLLVPVASDDTAEDNVERRSWGFITLDADTFQPTFAAADASNPRIDVVAVRATAVDDTPVLRDFLDAVGAVPTTQEFSSLVRTQVEYEVVTGIPAAVPVEPAPSAGFIKVAAVRIPAAAAAVELGDIRDHRMPLGYQRIVVHGQALAAIQSGTGGAPWLKDTGGNGGENDVFPGGGGAGSDDLYAFPFGLRNPANCRLIRASIFASFFSGPATSRMVRITLQETFGPQLSILGGADLAFAPALAADADPHLHTVELAGLASLGPLWGNGLNRPAPWGNPSELGLRLVNDDPASRVYRVIFDFAGGL